MEMTEIFLKGKEQEKINELKRIEGDIYKETRVHQEIVAAYNEMEKVFGTIVIILRSLYQETSITSL